jgi:cytochrome c551/c552
MRKILIAVIIILLIIQFIPVNKDNPESDPQSEIALQSDVKVVLEKACYDCHSNKTVWPWYSNVAPVSWFVVNHVEEARHELNFSIWQKYSKKRKSKKLKQIVEEVEEGEMPLFSYVLMHSQADLSDEEINTLKQ